MEPKEVLKKRGNKKDVDEEIEITKPKKRGSAKKKDEDIGISDGEAEIISVEVSKKLKPNGIILIELLNKNFIKVESKRRKLQL